MRLGKNYVGDKDPTTQHGYCLTHWGRVTHICVSDLTIIGSDNSLSPGRRQAIIRTNAEILLIRPLGTNFSEISIKIQIFSFKKMRLKVSSAKWRPFCLGLNVLTGWSMQSVTNKNIQVMCSASWGICWHQQCSFAIFISVAMFHIVTYPTLWSG